MLDQRKPIMDEDMCQCLQERMCAEKNEKCIKNRPVAFNENYPSLNMALFTEFNRYSFPLSPKARKTFNTIIRENISAQKQEKRAVSLMPEILLHAAVLDNNIDEILKLLKVECVDVNRGAKLGLFSLHEAVFSGLEQVTEILVDNGADVTLITPGGMTPLDAAVCAGSFECAEILIKNGAPIDSIKNGFVDRSF